MKTKSDAESAGPRGCCWPPAHAWHPPRRSRRVAGPVDAWRPYACPARLARLARSGWGGWL